MIRWAPILTDVEVTESSCIREQKSGSQIAFGIEVASVVGGES